MTILIVMLARAIIGVIGLAIRIVIGTIALVIGVLAHPVRTGMTLTRGASALVGCAGVLGGILALTIAPKTDLWGWIWPPLVILGGCVISYLYTLLPQSEARER